MYLQMAFKRAERKSLETPPLETVFPYTASLWFNMQFYAQHHPLFCEFTHPLAEMKNSVIAKRKEYWLDLMTMHHLRVPVHKNTC
jgi:hypothetical protein